MTNIIESISHNFSPVVKSAHCIPNILLIPSFQETYLLVFRQMIKHFYVLILLEPLLCVLYTSHLSAHSLMLRVQLLVKLEKVSHIDEHGDEPGQGEVLTDQ